VRFRIPIEATAISNTWNFTGPVCKKEIKVLISHVTQPQMSPVDFVAKWREQVRFNKGCTTYKWNFVCAHGNPCLLCMASNLLLVHRGGGRDDHLSRNSCRQFPPKVSGKSDFVSPPIHE
jgi:hypothetical protein